MEIIGIIVFAVFVLTVIYSLLKEKYESLLIKQKHKEEADLEKSKFNSWLILNLAECQNQYEQNKKDGEYLINEYLNKLCDLAKEDPVSFIKIYYSKCYSRNEIGTADVELYEYNYFKPNIENTVLKTLGYKKIGIQGKRISISTLIRENDSLFKENLLNSSELSTIEVAFYEKELNLNHFKNYNKYIKFGPFHWLREEKCLNPGTIRRRLNKINGYKTKRSHKKRFSPDNFEEKIIDNSKNFKSQIKSPTINNNEFKVKAQFKNNVVQEKVTKESLNDHIDKNKFSNPFNQPFVKQSNFVNRVNNSNLKQPFNRDTEDVFYDADIINENRTNVYKNIKQKSAQSLSMIYIIKTPFQAGDKIEIKIGESTNIKSRIDDYRQYWRDKFSIVFMAEGIVEEEKKLKQLLRKFHTSNEFFSIDQNTYNQILKSKDLHSLFNFVGQL